MLGERVSTVFTVSLNHGVVSQSFVILLLQAIVKGNFNTKDEAVNGAIAQMGDKAKLYGL